MAVSFRAPAPPSRDVLNIEYFKGVDMYNAPNNVEINRSPCAPNMIRDEVGKVRKRMGYRTVAQLPYRIDGCHTLRGEEKDYLVHAGEKLYKRSGEGEYTQIYDGMADERSVAVQFQGKLYILDGKKYLVYDGRTVAAVSEEAYIPTIIISRSPAGGGTTLEPLNLLQTRWTECFLGTEKDRGYQLTTAELDDTEVKAEILNAEGEWEERKQGIDFTVNRTLGMVVFTVAPGESPVTGMDNVRITASKRREGHRDRIDKCDISVLYGVGGAPDRLFVSGNPEHPNIDYYSQLNDPSYFGDTWYNVVGQDDSRIMGYSVISNTLAAHKSPGGDGRSIVVRNGQMNGTQVMFPVINTIQGEGCICKHAFGSVGKEPLFLSAMGVYAITAEDLTGEKYGQQRSLYISGSLRKEERPEDAFATVWRDLYMLSLNGRVYILDGLQREYQKNEPYSGYQYECYYWTGIDGRVMWEAEGSLWFGTSDGRICRFYNNVDDPKSYNDDGKSIEAYWDTPDFSGRLFYKNKTFRHIAVRLAAAIVTGIKVYVQERGIWSLLYNGGARARYLDFNYINFGKFTFSTDKTPRTLGGKIKVRNVDKLRFRLENSETDEPFGIYSVALEFNEKNNYRG